MIAILTQCQQYTCYYEEIPVILGFSNCSAIQPKPAPFHYYQPSTVNSFSVFHTSKSHHSIALKTLARPQQVFAVAATHVQIVGELPYTAFNVPQYSPQRQQGLNNFKTHQSNQQQVNNQNHCYPPTIRTASFYFEKLDPRPPQVPQC